MSGAPADTIHVERRRVCLAYSPGGHKAELDRALAGIHLLDACHVTFDDGRRPPPLAAGHRRHLVCHPRRSVGRTLLNAWQSLAILRRERPALVISTGADVAVPLLLLARCTGARVIFIETAGSSEPTLAGRLVYPFADLFVVQWPDRLRRFPKAVLAGGLLL